MFHVKRSLPVAAIALVLAAAAFPASSTAHPGHEPDELRQVREATSAFRDIEAAKAAGYDKVSECEDDPKYGGMGFHYGNPELITDGKLDATRPEILVYQACPSTARCSATARRCRSTTTCTSGSTATTRPGSSRCGTRR